MRRDTTQTEGFTVASMVSGCISQPRFPKDHAKPNTMSLLPMMPMKVAADDASGAPQTPLPPIPMPPPGAMPPPSVPPAMPPPPMMPPAAGPAPMGPGPMGPPPQSPMQMGPIDPKSIQTRTQDDGTIVGFVPLPDGSEHIVGVHPPFKLPKGQKPGAAGQGAPPMDLSRAALPQ